jgi:SnoaL-like domain
MSSDPKATPISVDTWVQRYISAWEAGDPNAVVALFTPEALYHSSVFREPLVGTGAIRDYWERSAASQRNVAVRTGNPMVSPARVAVEWWTTMEDPDEGEITLPGCLLLRFDPDGLCRELWEYWQLEPGRKEPPPGWGV